MNWLLSLAFDGFDYHGWQIQPEVPTIQGELEQALSIIHQSPIQIYGSGRTDAQVHANLFYANFHSSKLLSSQKWCHALNGLLPPAIRVQKAQHVSDDFHARHSSLKKRYRYLIQHSQTANPFGLKYAWHISQSLDFDVMQEATTFFEGSYDCSAFRSSACSSPSTFKHIDDVRLKRLVNHPFATHAIEIQANSFLQNMVRIMVGTLVDVGLGKIPAASIPKVIASQDRSQSGQTAPAHGLYADGAVYPHHFCIQ